MLKPLPSEDAIPHSPGQTGKGTLLKVDACETYQCAWCKGHDGWLLRGDSEHDSLSKGIAADSEPALALVVLKEPSGGLSHSM